MFSNHRVFLSIVVYLFVLLSSIGITLVDAAADEYLRTEGITARPVETDLYDSFLSDQMMVEKSDEPMWRFRSWKTVIGLTKDPVVGLKFASNPVDFLSVSAFGGLPEMEVPEEHIDITEYVAYGGKITARPLSPVKVGFSYKKKSAKEHDEITGINFSFNQSLLTFRGASEYGQNWFEHGYSAILNFRLLQLETIYESFNLHVWPDQIERESRLFGFLSSDDESVRIAGSDLTWDGWGALQVGLRGRRYDYDLRGESTYYSAGLLSLETRTGSSVSFEMGRMLGQTDETEYDLFRTEMVWRNPFGWKDNYISADSLLVDYDRQVGEVGTALHASLEAGINFLNDRLKTRLSGIYRQDDPYSKNKIGAMMKIEGEF